MFSHSSVSVGLKQFTINFFATASMFQLIVFSCSGRISALLLVKSHVLQEALELSELCSSNLKPTVPLCQTVPGTVLCARSGFSMENFPLWELEVGKKGKYERK